LAHTKRFQKLLIFSGSFNIFLAAPLVFPEFYKVYVDLLYRLNEWLTLGGVKPNLPQDGLSQLLINTAGIDLVLVGAIVIVSALDPKKYRIIPLLNAIGRTIFATIVVYYVISYDVVQLVLVIGLIDLLISAGFIYFLVKIRGE